MKKALPIILVLAALAAAAFVFFRKQPGGDAALGLAPGLAAELAPAETLVLIEVPDMARTAKRWEETSLYKIAQEPEWKEFTAKLDDFLFMSAPDKALFEIFNQIKEADPAGFFAATWAFDGPTPKFVGGIPYRGKKTAVKTAIEKLRELMFKGTSAVKSEIVKQEDTEIELVSGQGFSAAFAYRDNWFFFAGDVDQMKGLLQRYARAAGAPASLSKDALYLEALKQSLPDSDAAVFLRPGKIVDITMAAAPLPPATVAMRNEYVPEAILYSLKLDGPLMRDRIYVRRPQIPKAAPMTNRLLAFTSPQTYAYASGSTAGWEEWYTKTLQRIDSPSNQLAKELEKKSLKVEDIMATFGPELSIHSDWETGGIALPTLFAATEVRDPAKARLFADLIVAEMKTEGQLAEKEEDGTTYWTLTIGVPLVQPTLALNQKHMVFGLNYATAAGGIKQLKSGGPTLAQSPVFQSGMKTVVQPTVGTLYVDMKVLFERLYEKFKPMLAFQIAGSEEAAKYLDPGKLPKAETISKHLQPTVVAYGDAPQGFIIEGAGTVSLYGALLPPAVIMPAFIYRSQRVRAMPLAPPAQTVPPSPAPPK
jgi:hypothetical protein